MPRANPRLRVRMHTNAYQGEHKTIFHLIRVRLCAAPPNPPPRLTRKTGRQERGFVPRGTLSHLQEQPRDRCNHAASSRPNPFPLHKQLLNKRDVAAWRLIVTFHLFALTVGCICLLAATGKHLLCYRQPLAIGGAGVAASAAVCIWIDQIAYFKNCANGATILSK